MGRGHWSLDRLGFRHVALAEKVKNIALLRKNDSIGGGDGFHAEEVVERAQVLDGKINSKGLQEGVWPLWKGAGDENVIYIDENISDLRRGATNEQGRV
jgi:hypothetical protein